MDSVSHRQLQLNRRRFLGTVGGLTLLGTVPVQSAAVASDPFDGWFDDVPNYEGVSDSRGESTVRVLVGPNDELTFDPPAIRVDPGTTVVWEWAAGFHDVTATDDAFQSEMTDAVGHEFTQTFEEEGIHTYVCTPHESAGMKGAVVVGDEAASDAPAAAAPPAGGNDEEWDRLGAAFLGGTIWAGIIGYVVWAFNRRKRPVNTSRPPAE